MFFLMFCLLSLLAGIILSIVIVIKMPINVRKYVIAIVCILVLSLIGYGTYRYFSIERDGEVRAGYVRMGDRYYEGVGIVFSEEGKIIGKFDGYDIREIPEDPEHNFLVVRTFLDQYYVVDRDYVIPTEGELSCAYVSGKECDEELLATLNDILAEKYVNGFEMQMEQSVFHGVTVGYGDCPVATDSGYFIGVLKDGRWVLVYREDYEYDSEKGMFHVTCHEIKSEHAVKLQESGMFK